MAAISLTYTLTNGTTADASQVMQNYNDIVNGTSDGTKDFSINALTCAGTATLNGNVNLGNASGDDLTITASLASSLAIKTTATYNVGSATLGLLSLYLGTSTFTTRILGAATSSWTLTLPVDGGTANYALTTNGSGTTTWKAWSDSSWAATAAARGTVTTFVPVIASAVNSVSSASYTVLDNDGYDVILVTTGASQRTITLPTAADNAGRKLKIKKVDSGAGTVLIDGESSETIDGATTMLIGYQYGEVEIYCDGSAWYSSNVSESTTYTGSTSSLSGSLSSATLQAAGVIRIGNKAYISGHMTVNPSSTGGFTFDCALPAFVTNNFSNDNQAHGTFGNNGTAIIGRIVSKSSSTVVTFEGSATATGALETRFNMMIYIV